MKEDSVSIAQRLRAAFSVEPTVGFAYLFGSRARGDYDANSDYDVAVYIDERDPVRRNRTLLRLGDTMMNTLATDRVDVRCLNDIQTPELKYRILQEGMLLYENGPARIFVEPRILNEYFDFVYLLRKYHLTKHTP